MLAERINEWSEQLVQQGLQKGLQQGRAEERQLLINMAKLRFGPDCAKTLTPLLEKIDDSDRLANIGEWIIRCETGQELVNQVNKLLEKE